MRVLIAGHTEVAYTIAELLMRDHEVTLIEPMRQTEARVDRLDIAVVHGESTNAAVLRRAGMDRCGVFVAATNNDEKNLVSCIAAQRLGARRTICLLSRPGFVSVSEEDDSLADSLGIDAVVRPSEQLAHEILRIVTIPGALDSEAFAAGRVRLLRHVVEEGAPLTRKPLRDKALPKDVVLVMCRRGDKVFIPRGDTHFQAGDKVTAMGTPRGVHLLLYRFLRSNDHGEDQREAIIVGGGVVGQAVAEGLENYGWRVKVIESSEERCRELAPLLKGLVLHGDGSDVDLLEEEGVRESPVLIAVTNNDEKNLLISLLAQHLGVARVVTRADRLTNERMFEKVGIDVVRSARGAAIRKVVRDVVDHRHSVRAELEHGDVHVIELEVPADWPRLPLVDLRPPLFAIIGAVLRDEGAVIPHGDTEIRPGDHLYIFTSQKDEQAVREFMRKRPTPPGEES